MDASSDEWIAELGIMKVALEYDVTLSSESFTSCTTDELFGKTGFVVGAPHDLGFGRPTKMVKTSSSWGSSSTSNNEQIVDPQQYYQNSSPSSTPYFLSFANSNLNANSMPQIMDSNSKGLKLKPKVEVDNYEPILNNNTNSYVPPDHDQVNEVKLETQGVKKRARVSSMAASIPNSLGQEHVIAERKRREKLSERLIALSALIPGLKKMDKASVLGEAVKYLKHLQEQIKTLEEKAKQRNVESLVLVNKSRVYMDDDEDANSSSSNQEACNLRSEEASLPEIEARVMDREVLIRIHCEKKNGLLTKILNEMENLQLSITNSSSMPFGNYDLIITITAQMKANFSITTKDLVSKLRIVF